MDERDWLILKALYEKKNITKAAYQLYISQPSLTKRIQHIEKEFNTVIIERGKRGVQFTPQGEYLAKCADEMLLNLQTIRETVLNMSEEVTGTLRLAVSNYFTLHKLPKLLKLFRKKFPLVDFKVRTGWSRDVFNLVYNHEVHIGIVRGDYQWSDAKCLLFEENLCITSRDEIKLVDLPASPRIDYGTDPALKAIIDNWWSRNFSGPGTIGMEVDKGETCKEMVINGLGYGILPSVLVDQHQELHKIKLLDEDNQPIVRKTWMLYHEKSMEMNLISEFVRFVQTLDFLQDL
ncbi:DNA-binding transcriptional regulator, LysR family [Fictibacillus solisalsi]|uniref:DNA-binding transcriptional regulator, LysR family n=1 Tax=Fictibacillus solisalsi TaxID=459525 RepID=A0A1G9WK53_9BACL|nr:LysR family transcriptional regulator [Fictibacillus solisalsi]SDM84918.1 DNA-binding transcriptional regulator, LysR family [Fictibacillus solisalsi]